MYFIKINKFCFSKHIIQKIKIQGMNQALQYIYWQYIYLIKDFIKVYKEFLQLSNNKINNLNRKLAKDIIDFHKARYTKDQ